MAERICTPNDSGEREHLTTESCYILELYNTAEDASVSVARARVLPGVTTQLHLLRGIDERYLILSGKAKVEIGRGTWQSLQTGDGAFIPSDTPQRISNTGAEDLIFLCVCTPRFEWRHYLALE